jgi:hypothetical protein
MPRGTTLHYARLADACQNEGEDISPQAGGRAKPPIRIDNQTGLDRIKSS